MCACRWDWLQDQCTLGIWGTPILSPWCARRAFVCPRIVLGLAGLPLPWSKHGKNGALFLLLPPQGVSTWISTFPNLDQLQSTWYIHLSPSVGSVFVNCLFIRMFDFNSHPDNFNSPPSQMRVGNYHALRKYAKILRPSSLQFGCSGPAMRACAFVVFVS